MIFKLPGPVWKDGCNHPCESYIGSFETLGEKFDLYLFPDEFHGQGICIRYSDEDSEYMSPGGIVNLIKGARCGMESYCDALELLLDLGKIVWTKKG